MSDAPRPPEKSGPGIGAGVGIGCGAHVLGFLLFMATGSLLPYTWGAVKFVWPFVLVLILSVALLIVPRTRRIGAGMTIVAAAAWIIVIGPCIGLIGGFGGL
ncbi:hypothetical protein DY023_02300 [Microbacterium bovistercoris]|uniref:Uncharacterized protein n=1 Tax=Microbacterium bovistercoris TaxID=2293570 RepID=A0A371NXA6_9MICO|nr:hypothetical protein [Microbacterium bovistercoris]REJ07818.1 hypothetical protein DY023_02300 [Microbacterium bovistercoris]